jgi:hypothetical protein
VAFIAESMAAGKMMGLRGEPWAPPTSKDLRSWNPLSKLRV